MSCAKASMALYYGANTKRWCLTESAHGFGNNYFEQQQKKSEIYDRKRFQYISILIYSVIIINKSNEGSD